MTFIPRHYKKRNPLDRQVLGVRKPPPMAEHRYEIGEIPDSQMVSASCACGWSFVQGYARPTGRPVAVRLAMLRFGQHAELAAERDNLLGDR